MRPPRARRAVLCLALLAGALMIALSTRRPPLDACLVRASLPRHAAPGVPRLIHMQWQGGMGETQRRTLASYRRLFPGWEVRVWNDSALENLFLDAYPWFAETWRPFPGKIQRIDAARYFILHLYGGLYVDADYEALEYFGDMLDPRRVSLPESPLSSDELVQNSLVASPPRHAFWEYVFRHMEARRGSASVPHATGCGMLSELARQHPAMVYVLPCEVFMRQAPWIWEGDLLSAFFQKLVFPPLGLVKRCGKHGDACEMAVHWGTSLRP